MAYQRELIRQTARTIARQVTAVGALAAGFAWWGHPDWALGLAYGAGLAALLAAMLAASLLGAAERGQQGGAACLYRGAIQRFLVVGLAIGIAAKGLELHVGGVILGLILAHIVSFIEAARLYGTPSSEGHQTQ